MPARANGPRCTEQKKFSLPQTNEANKLNVSAWRARQLINVVRSVPNRLQEVALVLKKIFVLQMYQHKPYQTALELNKPVH